MSRGNSGRRWLRPGDRLLGYTLVRELASGPDVWRWDAGDVEVVALRPHAVLVPGFRDGFWKAGEVAEGGGVRLATISRGEEDGMVVRVRAGVRGALGVAAFVAPNDVAAWLASEVPEAALVEDIVLDHDGVPRYWPLGRPSAVSVAPPATVWRALGVSRADGLAFAAGKSTEALRAAAVAAAAEAPTTMVSKATRGDPTFATLVHLGGSATNDAVAAWTACDVDCVRRAGERRHRWALAAGDLPTCLRASQHAAALGWTVEVVDLNAPPPRFWMAMFLAGGGNLPLLGADGIVVGGVTISHTAIVAAGVGLAVASVASLVRAAYKLGRWRRAQEARAAWHAHEQAREGELSALLAPDTSALPDVVARDVAEALACARDRLAALTAGSASADPARRALTSQLRSLAHAISDGSVTSSTLAPFKP